MKVAELFEGDVVRGKFEQRLRSKRGMYKNPDIEVPTGYVRFECEPLGPNSKGGKIIGITADGRRKVVSTVSDYNAANVLAGAYNAGGYTTHSIEKVPLSSIFREANGSGSNWRQHWREPQDSKLHKVVGNVRGKEVPIQPFNVTTVKMNSVRLSTASSYYTDQEEDARDIRQIAALMKKGRKFEIIEVIKTRAGNGFQITDGNHRFLAWKSLGNDTIPVWILA